MFSFCLFSSAPESLPRDGDDPHLPFPDLHVFFAMLVSVLIWNVPGYEPRV